MMRFLERLRPFHRRRHEDERGAVLVLTAASMVLILGAGALGVDLGFTVYGSRSAQAMADAAGYDLAQHIPTIDAEPNNAAVATFISSELANVDTDNGSNAAMTAVPGLYSDGTFTPPAGGCAGTTYATPPYQCNAIEVYATQTVPQPFWGGFNALSGHGQGTGPTTPPGTGCTPGSPPCPPPPTCCPTVFLYGPEAGISVGSFLVNASYPLTSPANMPNAQQQGVLNDLLSELGTANVTLVGYQGLAGTYVSLSQLIAASGGVLTPQNIMTASLTSSQWNTILSAAVTNLGVGLSCGASPVPLPCEASTALSSINANSSTSAQLCQMISVNGSSCANGTVTTTGLNADVNLLQMLTTEAELANGTNALNVKSALGITGLLSASLKLTLISPAATNYGPVGSIVTPTPCPVTLPDTSTCAKSQQVSVDFQYTVNNLLGQPQSFDIPLSAATGYAVLNSVSCDTSNVFQSMSVIVTTTAASGNVTMNGTSLGTVTVNGVTNKSATFNESAPNAVPPTAQSAAANKNPTNFGSNGNHPPTFTYSGTGFSTLDSTLSAVLATVSSALGPVLQMTGATVGGASVAGTGDPNVAGSAPNCKAYELG